MAFDKGLREEDNSNQSGVWGGMGNRCARWSLDWGQLPVPLGPSHGDVGVVCMDKHRFQVCSYILRSTSVRWVCCGVSSLELRTLRDILNFFLFFLFV